MHIDISIKPKIKIYKNRININFQSNKIPVDNVYCTCLSVVLLNYVIKIDSDYYPEIFFEECK